MKEFKILDRKTSYYFLKKDFISAYKNNGKNIPLALQQVAKLRDLDFGFVKSILSKYINGIQYKEHKICPNCKQEWNGIECKHCSFDTGFDPNWDLD
jgi:hypothetical protein